MVSCRSIIAHISPQPSQLGFSQSRRQHRHRRVIGMQLRRAQHVSPQRFDQRLQQRVRAAYPIGERRAVQFHALALVNLFLAIEWKVIAVLRHPHVRQKSRARHAPCEGTARRFCLHDLLAPPAGQLFPHLSNDLETRRDVFEHLRNILAQMLQLPAAVGTRGVLRRNLPRLARQVFRQRPPRRFPAVSHFRPRDSLRNRSGLLGPARLQLVQLQLQLLDLPG